MKRQQRKSQTSFADAQEDGTIDFLNTKLNEPMVPLKEVARSRAGCGPGSVLEFTYM
jgi:hypothetical protein